MKRITAVIAALALSIGGSSLAGEPGSWQVEPPGEGSAEAYVYTTSHGRFLAGPDGSGLWVVYGGVQKPRADGTCTFDSCYINVTLDGAPGYGQDWVKFAFSDGSSVLARPNVKAGQYNVTNDSARVNWPIVKRLIAGLQKSDWVQISFADGKAQRFGLAGSSAALKRGAAAVR